MTMTKTPPKAGSRRRKRTKPKPVKRTAATSDRHELYELSVQNTESEVDFIDQVWQERRGRFASKIREDFCGTAASSMEWIKRRPTNTAIAVDIDSSVLDWGRARIPERLSGAEQDRITLVQGDVLTMKTDLVDTVLAMNFSYYLLLSREELRSYFKKVRASLVSDGLFIIDAYGGSDSFVEMEEEREVEDFVYVWDQESYDPISGHATNHIHYLFDDGTEIRKAFSYSWRLWTLPEIRETLLEAGFSKATVYWEGTDPKTGEGDDEFRVAERGDADLGWIAYVVADR